MVLSLLSPSGAECRFRLDYFDRSSNMPSRLLCVISRTWSSPSETRLTHSHHLSQHNLPRNPAMPFTYTFCTFSSESSLSLALPLSCSFSLFLSLSLCLFNNRSYTYSVLNADSVNAVQAVQLRRSGALDSTPSDICQSEELLYQAI